MSETERDAAWVNYEWPEWVPAREREMIESFWGARNGRTPANWEDSSIASYNDGRPLGARVRMWACFARGLAVEGRYLHRWNNIAAVITDDGASVSVSGHADDASIQRAIVSAERRASMLAEDLDALRAHEAALRAMVSP